MKKILFPFLLLLLSVACDSDTPAPQTPFTPIVINFNVMTSGQLSTAASDILPGNYVITNQNDWTLLLNRINSAFPTPTPTLENTVDFNEFTVIAVFDIERSGGGGVINITSIVENQEQIDVNVIGQQGGALNILLQAYQVVKMPINPKPIVFN